MSMTLYASVLVNHKAASGQVLSYFNETIEQQELVYILP